MNMQIHESTVQPVCPACHYGTKLPDPNTLELMIDCEACGQTYVCRVKTNGGQKLYCTAPTTLPESSPKPPQVPTRSNVQSTQLSQNKPKPLTLDDQGTDFHNKQAPRQSDARSQLTSQMPNATPSRAPSTPKAHRSTQPTSRTNQVTPSATSQTSQTALSSSPSPELINRQQRQNNGPIIAKPLNPYEIKLIEVIKEQLAQYKDAKQIRSAFFYGFYLLSALGVFISYYVIDQPAIALGFCIWSIGAAFNYFLIAGFFNTHENVIFSRTRRLWDDSTIVDKFFALLLTIGVTWTLFQYDLLITSGIFWTLSIGFGFLMAQSMDHQVRATRFSVVRTLFKTMDNLKYKKHYCNNLRVALCRYTDKYWYELYEYMFGYDETLLVRKELSDEGVSVPYKKWRHIFTGWIDERILSQNLTTQTTANEADSELKQLLNAQTHKKKNESVQTSQPTVDTSKLKQLISSMENSAAGMSERDFAQNSQRVMSELLSVQQSLLLSRIEHTNNKSGDIAVPTELLHARILANTVGNSTPQAANQAPAALEPPTGLNTPAGPDAQSGSGKNAREAFHNQLIDYIKQAVIPELKVIEKDRPAPRKPIIQLDASIMQLFCATVRLIALASGGAMMVMCYLWLKQNKMNAPEKILDYFADSGMATQLSFLLKADLPEFLMPWVPNMLSGLQAGLAGFILAIASLISPFFRAIILMILAAIVLTIGSGMSWH